MADAYQLETTTDRYLLEDGTGVYLLEQQQAVDDLATKLLFLPAFDRPSGMLMISGG